MREKDWNRVYDIYRQGMKTNLATFTVEEMSYEVFDQGRLEKGRFVILDQDDVVGWTTLKQAYEDIPEYHGVAEISVYVDENYQGTGIATKLLRYLIDYSEKEGYWMLEADIFANNKGSIHLHEKCGFRQAAYREKIGKDRFGEWRDTVLMERRSKVIGAD